MKEDEVTVSDADDEDENADDEAFGSPPPAAPHFAAAEDELQTMPRRRSSLALLDCTAGVLLSEVADLQRLRIACAAEGKHERGHALDAAIAKRFRLLEE